MRKMKFALLGGLCLFSSMAHGQAAAKTATPTEKTRAADKGNALPQIDIEHAPAPLYRDPVYDGVADPSIVWNAEKQEWTMFYTQRRARLTALEGVAYCYGSAIGVAVSKNGGATWEYNGTAALSQPDGGLNTFWAPQVVRDAARNKYHLFVTYIKGVYSSWGGEPNIFHYTSSDLSRWHFEEKIATEGCIDASVFQLEDGSWKMWYKDEKRGALIYTAASQDLSNWRLTNEKDGGDKAHEGPVVFKWGGRYWMLTDMWNGLNVYASPDARTWEHNNTILSEPGMRPDDNVMGRHADVVIAEGRAFVVYFTHPGRIYKDGVEELEASYRYRRSSLQIAELEIRDGKLVCDRDKYYPRQ